MMNRTTTEHDANTGETIVREMSDEEYTQLLADGFTPEFDEVLE